MNYHLEGSLASFIHAGGLRYADVFPLPPARHIAPGGMDPGRGGDVVLVRLRLRYVAAQRGTLASPWRSCYGDTSSPRSLRARAGFYSQLAWFWLSDVPFFMPLYVNVNASKAWTIKSLSLPISSPQLTAAAGNYAYVDLRLLGEIDVAVAPGGRQHHPFLFTLTYLFSSSNYLGNTGAFGPGF
jgi:hypothetical protein